MSPSAALQGVQGLAAVGGVAVLFSQHLGGSCSCAPQRIPSPLFVLEIWKACFVGLIESPEGTEELKWTAFTFLKVGPSPGGHPVPPAPAFPCPPGPAQHQNPAQRPVLTPGVPLGGPCSPRWDNVRWLSLQAALLQPAFQSSPTFFFLGRGRGNGGPLKDATASSGLSSGQTKGDLHVIPGLDTCSACAVLLCSLSVGHIAPPRVFQIPQVLVKLKKYPQGDKVRLGGPWSCRQRRVRADGACPDPAGARPKLGEGGWGGKKGLGGKGRLVPALPGAEGSPLCTAGFHRGCELRLRVPAEADPAARHGRSAMQVSVCVPWARWQHCEPVASLSPPPPNPLLPPASPQGAAVWAAGAAPCEAFPSRRQKAPLLLCRLLPEAVVLPNEQGSECLTADSRGADAL